MPWCRRAHGIFLEGGEPFKKQVPHTLHHSCRWKHPEDKMNFMNESIPTSEFATDFRKHESLPIPHSWQGNWLDLGVPLFKTMWNQSGQVHRCRPETPGMGLCGARCLYGAIVSQNPLLPSWTKSWKLDGKGLKVMNFYTCLNWTECISHHKHLALMITFQQQHRTNTNGHPYVAGIHHPKFLQDTEIW